MTIHQTDRALRLPQVIETLALSRATIWRRVKAEAGFPQPFKNGGCTCWLESDVNSYLKGLAKGGAA